MTQVVPNSSLSLCARGLLALFTESGRVFSAEEARSLVPEGRDKIRKAFNELKDAGYISVRKFKTRGGQWNYEYSFASDWSTSDGFSGALHRGTDYIANSSSVLVGFNKLNPTNTSSTLEISNDQEEYVPMPWPGMSEPEEDLPRSKKKPKEDSVGVVGKLEDKREARKAKYKKTKFDALPARMQRHTRLEEDWTTDDLVGEFYDLTRDHAPGVPSQVHGVNLAKWINQKVGEGIPRIALLKAIRGFFNDPRLIHDAGIGTPLWRRFIAFYPTVHGIYNRKSDVEYSDDNFEAHQAKMLKLLED